MSDQDDLLKLLGRAAREEEIFDDPRWEAFAAGTLAEDQAADLRRRAEATAAGRAALAVYRPVDAEASERAAARILAEQRAADLPPAADLSPAKRPSIRRRALSILRVALPLAATFLIALLILRPSLKHPTPLPSYEIRVTAGERASMSPEPASAPPEQVELGPGSWLKLIAAPDTAITGTTVVFRTYLIRAGEIRPWSPAAGSVNNVLTIAGTREDLFEGVPAGAWEIAVVVGPPEAYPAEDELRRIVLAPGAEAGTGLQIKRRRVVLRDGKLLRFGPLEEPQFAGCAAVRRGPLCEIPESGAVRVWVGRAEGPEITATVDGERRQVERRPTQGGALLIFAGLPESARGIAVTTPSAGSGEAFRLKLAPRTPAPDIDAAEALRSAGKVDEAKARLEALLKKPTTDPVVRARATGKLARVERYRRRIDPAIKLFNEAIALDREAGLLSDEVSDRLGLTFTLIKNKSDYKQAREVLDGIAPMLREHPEEWIGEAHFRGLLAEESGDLRGALDHYHRMAKHADRLGSEAGARDAAHLIAGVFGSMGRYAEALATLRSLEQALPQGAPPCDRATLLTNIGWLAFLQAESLPEVGEQASAEDPLRPLSEASDLCLTTCADPSVRAAALINLALARMSAGDAGGARRELTRAKEADPNADASIQAWWAILEGKLLLKEGRAEQAIQRYRDLVKLVESRALPHDALNLPEALYEARLGEAQAFDVLGKPDEALAAFQAAESVVEAWSPFIPLGEGLGFFVTRYDRGARLWVDFLLRRAEQLAREGHVAGADEAARQGAEVARRNRRRLLAALGWLDRVGGLPKDRVDELRREFDAYRAARSDIEAKASAAGAAPSQQRERMERALSTERASLRRQFDRIVAKFGHSHVGVGADAAIEPPPEGSLILVYHPVPGGWASFALRPGSALGRRLGPIRADASNERLSEQLLHPFDGFLGEAREVRFLVHRALGEVSRRIRLHELPWKGRPLMESVPVVYPLDLPIPARREPPAEGASAFEPRAVVVANPTRDLPGAKASGQLVVATLRRSGWDVAPLEEDSATLKGVLEALASPRGELFHYAGHAQFRGVDGMESSLLLAGDEQLTVPDVLALPRVPPAVVLTGCETAVTSHGRPASGDGAAPAAFVGSEGIGLAHAFILAGAQAVLATDEPILNVDAACLMSALYAALPPGRGLETALLKRAQAASLHTTGAGGCEVKLSEAVKFRLLVPESRNSPGPQRFSVMGPEARS